MTTPPDVVFRALCHDCRKQHTYREPLGRCERVRLDWWDKHRGHRVQFTAPVPVDASRTARWLADLKQLLGLISRDGIAGLSYDHNANIKLAWAGSPITATQTSLDGLATSSTWVAGWKGAAIDNTSDMYEDYELSAAIKVAAAGVSAGEIRVYLIPARPDDSWPGGFDGNEGTITISSTQIRDAVAKLGAFTATTSTTGVTYDLIVPSVAHVFKGNLPRKFLPFITHSTGANLETTGDPNIVLLRGAYRTVA